MAEPGKAPYPPEQPSDDGAQLLGSNSVIAVRMEASLALRNYEFVATKIDCQLCASNTPSSSGRRSASSAPRMSELR
jgi:hypothetical protein